MSALDIGIPAPDCSRNLPDLDGFAAAGSAPAAADTPAEVLTRASEAGLVRSGSAGTLTGLFRRARYSSQPMTSADSAAAAAALDQMRGDLAESAAVPS